MEAQSLTHDNPISHRRHYQHVAVALAVVVVSAVGVFAGCRSTGNPLATPVRAPKGSDSGNVTIIAPAGAAGRIPVGAKIERDSVQVILDAVEFTPDKLTLYYRINSLKPSLIGYLKEPRVTLSDGTNLARTSSGIMTGVTGEESKVSFRQLPPNAPGFAVDFGPFSWTTEKSQTFVFLLPDKLGSLHSDKPILLKERVTLGDAEYRALLTLGPSLNLKPSEFLITFEASNDVARANYLVAGPLAKVAARDDTGRVFTSTGSGWFTLKSSQTGELVVGQEDRFGGEISPDARQLTLQIDGTGEILRGPWTFNINIVNIWR